MSHPSELMSKVTQIQSALLALSGGAFQKLAEHYLAKLGHRPLYPIGSVAGADKPKTGTPDALAITEDGRYTFFEHTTQRSGVATKLADDLAKCLDEDKTGIAVEDIDRIVLCSTSDLSAAEIDRLRQTAQEAGVKLDLVGLQDLSYDLLSTYPGLARDHLGIEVDTGQILPPDEFVAAYGANRLAAPLDTGFLFRDDELDQTLAALDTSDLVVVAGPAGVGKSRLALEAAERYADAHPRCTVRCLFNRGASVYEDLRVHLAEPGAVVLVVDDANRLSAFDYVVQLVAEQRDDQTIKVIATVRDYAVDRVLDAVRPLGGHGHVALDGFSDDEVKDLARGEFGILNGEYLDRIATLAQGNARLAVMAARVAIAEQDLAALHDATHLYDAYFASVRDDLRDRGDLVSEDLLRVAGIVGFFGAVDRTNADQMSAIADAFGLAPAEFWEHAKVLHDLEVLDMYEREIVRPSDQILSTYLAYLALFRERVLDVSALLAHFFPARMPRFFDTLNPILSALDAEAAVAILEPAVLNDLANAEDAGDSDRVLRLVDHFGPLIPTRALHVAKRLVEAVEPEDVAPDEVSYAPNSSLGSPSVVSVLASFAGFDETRVRLAVRLLLDHIARRPSTMPQGLHVLVESYGPRHDSYKYGFNGQRAVVREVRTRAEASPVLFGPALLAIAGAYLRCHFMTTSSPRTNGIMIHRFDMPPTDGAKALRQDVWRGVLDLYRVPSLRPAVEDVVRSYAMNARFGATDALVSADADVVFPFLESEMEPDRLLPCLAAHDALDFFESHSVEIPTGLRERFTNEAYTVLDVFLTDRRELRAEGLDYDEIQERREADLRALVEGYDAEDYCRLFETAQQILETLDRTRDGYQVSDALYRVFRDLAERDADLLEAVLGAYLADGEFLRIEHVPIPQFIEAIGPERTLRLLSEHEYDTKPIWLLAYYGAVPEADIQRSDAEALVRLFENAAPQYLRRGLDVLLRARHVRPRIVPEVVEILVRRADDEESSLAVSQVLDALFASHGSVASDLKGLFADDVPVLLQAYAVVARHTRVGDYRGDAIDQMLDLDPDFIDTFVDGFYRDDQYPRWEDDSRDYAFFWTRTDHRALAERVVRRFAVVDFAGMMVQHSFLQSIFSIQEGKDPDGLIRQRQDATLRHVIQQHSDDDQIMSVVSSLWTGFSAERRRDLVATFLRVNRDFDAFRKLDLVSSMTSSRGNSGMVGAHLAKADVLDSFLPLLDDVDLLEHKMHVENLARHERSWAEREKRRAFADV